MKKFIVCLLLICIIVLGCLAFTGCDKQSDDDIPRNTFWKVENSPLCDNCYAFYYTGEYTSFSIALYYRDNIQHYYDLYFSSDMYCETLTIGPASSNHRHIIKPNTIVYLHVFEPSTRLEFIAHIYDNDANITTDKVIFSAEISN